MKRMLLVFVALLVALTQVSAVSAQFGRDTATDQANPTTGCGMIGYDCEVVMFTDVASNGSISAIMAQKVTWTSALEADLFISDTGITEYMNGLGPEMFSQYTEITAEVTLDSVSTPEVGQTPMTWSYRLFEGKSALMGNPVLDDAMVVFLNASDGTSYVVIAINPTDVVEDYVLSIMAEEDYTEEPKGYDYFPM